MRKYPPVITSAYYNLVYALENGGSLSLGAEMRWSRRGVFFFVSVTRSFIDSKEGLVRIDGFGTIVLKRNYCVVGNYISFKSEGIHKGNCSI